MKNSRYIIVGITLLIVGFLVYYFSSIVAYVLIAWVFSLIGQPIMDLLMDKINLKRFKWGASMSAIISMLTIVGVFGLLIQIFVPRIITQFSTIDYDKFTILLNEPIYDLDQWLQKKGINLSVENGAVELSKMIKDWLRPEKIGEIFNSLITVASNFLIGAFSIFFITFFFLKEENLFTNIFVSIVPGKYEKKVRDSIVDIRTLLTRYFGGILIQITIIIIFVSFGLKIMGVQNALLIAFFAAIINVIPYVGPLIGALFGVVLTISASVDLDMEFYAQTLPLILKVVGVFALMQAMDNFILQPYIFSKRVNAHPLEVFIIILVGSQLAGIPGMILAIPTYTVFRVIARSFLSQFKVIRSITKSLGE